jgi:hypothetical protein
VQKQKEQQENAIETSVAQSFVVVQNLLVHSVSSIAYLRDFFPESHFQDQTVYG